MINDTEESNHTKAQKYGEINQTNQTVIIDQVHNAYKLDQDDQSNYTVQSNQTHQMYQTTQTDESNQKDKDSLNVQLSQNDQVNQKDEDNQQDQMNQKDQSNAENDKDNPYMTTHKDPLIQNKDNTTNPTIQSDSNQTTEKGNFFF